MSDSLEPVGPTPAPQVRVSDAERNKVVEGFALFGGVDVLRLPAETNDKGLKESRRVARAIERGHHELG